MASLEDQFCSVFMFSGNLYLDREEEVNGPRCAIFPPQLLDKDIDAAALGKEIDAALTDYRDAGRSIFADEWEALNQELLDFFGVKSVALFERKKKEVTVRREIATGEICLFFKGKEYVLGVVSEEDLGNAVRERLGLGTRKK